MRIARSWPPLFAVLVTLAFASTGSAAANPSRPRVEVTFQAPVRVTVGQLHRAAELMQHRATDLGLRASAAWNERAQTATITLDDVGLDVARRQAALIGGRGDLAIYDLTPSLVVPSISANQQPLAQTSLLALLSQAHSGPSHRPAGFYLISDRTGQPLEGPAPTRAALAGPAGSPPPGDTIEAVPARTVVLTCSAATTSTCPGLAEGPLARTVYYYLVKNGTYPGDRESPYPQITRSDIKSAQARKPSGPFGRQLVVALGLTPAGIRAFQRLTAFEARRGQATGVMRGFAIAVDDQIYSTPVIDYSQYPDGIKASGGIDITGLATSREAHQLALLLHAAPLPTTFRPISFHSS